MKNVIIVFSLIAVLFISGCKGNKINSTWNSGQIKIDGSDSDWGNSLIYNKDAKFMFGVKNDNKNMYLCMVTNDPDLERKILHLGLTVWLDREGSDRQVFGIKYPLNFQDMDRSSFRRPEQGEMDRQDMNQQKMEERFLARQTEVEIVGKNKDDVSRVPITALKGLKLKMAIKNYRLVYEMKIPLHPSQNAPYTINSDTGKVVSIGLTTGTIDRSKFKNRKRGEDRGEGGLSVDGDGGYNNDGDESGEGGMRGGNFNKADIEPLQYWAEVKLAGKAK